MNYFKEKNGINAFTLKMIAIIGMTLDHIGNIFGSHFSLGINIALFTFGGLTFPIMAYLLVEGYKHTSNVKRYGLRLLCWAAIAFFPFVWATHMIHFNVLFTLLTGLIALYLYDHMKNRIFYWIVFVLLTALTLIMDWALMGVPMILLYYVIQNKRLKVIIPALIPMFVTTALFIATCIASNQMAIDMIPDMSFAIIGCGLSIPLLLAYNGKRGCSIKYFFYAYYPLHLLILCLICAALFHEWSILS